jgi:hypothetical protein
MIVGATAKIESGSTLMMALRSLGNMVSIKAYRLDIGSS